MWRDCCEEGSKYLSLEGGRVVSCSWREFPVGATQAASVGLDNSTIKHHKTSHSFFLLTHFSFLHLLCNEGKCYLTTWKLLNPILLSSVGEILIHQTCVSLLGRTKNFLQGEDSVQPQGFWLWLGLWWCLVSSGRVGTAGPSQGAETPPSKPSRACTSSVLFGLLVHQNIWECFSLGRWSCRCGSREWKCAVKWVLHCQGMLNISHRVSRNGCR